MAGRRAFLRATGAIGIASLAGCTAGRRALDDLDIDDRGVEDTDGDGVIDREDYAPWDPSVQAKSDLLEGPTDTPTPAPAESETRSPATATPTPTSGDGAFRYTFADGKQGWTFGKRTDSRASAGAASWSEKYGGSLRLHVDGAPSTIQAWKRVGPLPDGTTIAVNYAPTRFDYAAAGLSLVAVVPGEERIGLDIDNDQARGGHEQDGTLTGDIPDGLPPEAEIEVKLTIWPGETTVWVQDVTGR